MNDRHERSDLTPEEAPIVGSPGDLVSEAAVAPRRRSESVMLALRIDREVFDALGRSADADGRTLSDTVHSALLEFVRDNAATSRYPERDASSKSADAAKSPFKRLLGSVPNAGRDDDFVLERDLPREPADG